MRVVTCERGPALTSFETPRVCPMCCSHSTCWSGRSVTPDAITAMLRSRLRYWDLGTAAQRSAALAPFYSVSVK